jgi:hypothetical protein
MIVQDDERAMLFVILNLWLRSSEMYIATWMYEFDIIIFCNLGFCQDCVIIEWFYENQ